MTSATKFANSRWSTVAMVLLSLVALGLMGFVVASLFETSAASERLAAYGVYPTRTVAVTPLAVIIVTVLALFMTVDGEWRGYRGAELGVAVVAVCAFILGYQQWLDGRRETSFDKYYERLDGADRRLENWPAAQAMLNQFWGGGLKSDDFQRYNYIWVELDNLEYMLEKYKLGYVRADHALRAVETFASRCESSEFREVLESVANIKAGYHGTTVGLATRVCKSR
jgi:hypothetical protein